MSHIRNGEPGESAWPGRSRARPLRALLTAAGVGVFLYVVYRMGWRTILDNIAQFGAWFVVISLLQVVWVVLQATSWYTIQNGLFHRAGFLSFVRIKIISDTMNTVLPAANLGGDAMRAFLIKPRIPLKEGVAGIMVDKAVESLAGVLFMAFGILIPVVFVPIPRVLLVPAGVSLLVLLAAVALLVLFQFRGFYRSATNIFGWIPAVRRWLHKNEEWLRVLDDHMRRSYLTGRTRIPLATGLHLMARLVGVLEVVVVLRVLHQPVTYLGAWFISAAVTVANTVLFIVPGHWGVQEGTSVLVMKAMSFSGSAGLSLAVIRRIRRLFLIGFGLLLLHLDEGIPPADAMSSASDIPLLRKR